MHLIMLFQFIGFSLPTSFRYKNLRRMHAILSSFCPLPFSRKIINPYRQLTLPLPSSQKELLSRSNFYQNAFPIVYEWKKYKNLHIVSLTQTAKKRSVVIRATQQPTSFR
jgi:hypothetical protein